MLHDVMITCPTTQLPLATGVQLSQEVFATAVFANVRAACPHCEDEHRWNKADAFLQEVKREAYGAAPPLRFVSRGRPKSAPPPTT
jgi:hypothetical protein